MFFDESGKAVFRIDTCIRNVRPEGPPVLVLSRGYLDESNL